MKRLIVEKVNEFRSLVRSQARAAGQARRQDRLVHDILLSSKPIFSNSFIRSSLPIPTRDDIISSPVTEFAPANGATSGFTAPANVGRASSPILDDPSEELERELAGTHLGQRA